MNEQFNKSFKNHGAPGVIRTPDLLVRSQLRSIPQPPETNEISPLDEQINANEGPPKATIASKKNCNRRMSGYGDGSVYQRGNIWWYSYSRQGRQYNKSSGSRNKEDAVQMLRYAVSSYEDEGVCAHIVRSHTGLLKGGHKCDIGAVSEMIVAVDLMNRGFSVYRSLSPIGIVDLVALSHTQTLLVEVKSNSSKLRPNQRRHNLLAVVTRSGGITYLPEAPEVLTSAEDAQGGAR